MTRLEDLMEGFSASGMDLETITEALLNEVVAMSAAEMRQELRPLLRNYARMWERSVTRAAESAYQEARTGGVPVDSTAAQKELFNTHFFSPLRGYVLWGEATIADHRAYAAMQRKLAAGAIRTAERHEEAADECEAEGVNCLFELYEKRRRAA